MPIFRLALPVTVRRLKVTGRIPRLAGQLNDYIINKVANWNIERGQDPANPDTQPSCSRLRTG